MSLAIECMRALGDFDYVNGINLTEPPPTKVCKGVEDSWDAGSASTHPDEEQCI